MKKTFKISGIHCESCVKLIEAEFENKINRISINLKNGEAIIDFDPKKISEDKISDIIENLGYAIE